MKRILFAAAGMITLGLASASAADLAARPYAKAPAPIIAAAYDWSGFYIGANGGWGSSRKCWDFTSGFGLVFNPAIAEGCHDATGGTAGGQIGYRWHSSAWVFGVEAQGNWADFRGSNPTPITFGVTTNRSRVDAFGLFTGQIGYSWNAALLYVKGGAAVTNDKYESFLTATGVLTDRATETRWGAVVGVGLEYAFAPNWSAALEYDHMFMGSRDNNFALAAAPFTATRTDRIQQDVDIVTVRVNYRWGGPVVAKY